MTIFNSYVKSPVVKFHILSQYYPKLLTWIMFRWSVDFLLQKTLLAACGVISDCKTNRSRMKLGSQLPMQICQAMPFTSKYMDFLHNHYGKIWLCDFPYIVHHMYVQILYVCIPIYHIHTYTQSNRIFHISYHHQIPIWYIYDWNLNHIICMYSHNHIWVSSSFQSEPGCAAAPCFGSSLQHQLPAEIVWRLGQWISWCRNGDFWWKNQRKIVV